MSGILAKSRSDRGREGRDEPRYWDEGDSEVLHHAVIEACRIYQYRNFEENLRKFGWKQARKRALAHGALSNEWARHRRGDVRLRRRGLEVRFRQRTKLIGWGELQEFVLAEPF